MKLDISKLKTLPAQDLQKILPHRYPFLLVDRVGDVVASAQSPVGDRVIVYKSVSQNEPFFQGHFPGHPIMPGVLIVEAMSQAASILVYRHIQWQSETDALFLTGIDNAKFRHPVQPGHLLRLELQTKKVRQLKFWEFEAKAYLETSRYGEMTEDVLAAEAYISVVIMLGEQKV